MDMTDNVLLVVDAVDSQTTLSFVPNTAAIDWDTNDVYQVLLSQGVAGSSYASSETDLWTTTHRESRPEMDVTQANTYGQQLLKLYEKPVQQQSFILGSRTIQDRNGGEWPLWRSLMGDSFYFRINDLLPEAALLSSSDDRSQAFMAVALDYTYNNNRLRVVPSTGDSRLDAVLNQADIVSGQIISTALEIEATQQRTWAAGAAQRAYAEQHKKHMAEKRQQFMHDQWLRKNFDPRGYTDYRNRNPVPHWSDLD